MKTVACDLGWLWQLSAVLLTLDACHVSGKKSKPAPKPHLIMIVADDLGWDDVSFHGSPQIPTPHIDKLANEGVILNSYYVSPICTPTRASLMTGKHPINLGLQHGTIFGTQPYGLPLGETTTPQYLKALGYRTHGVGKWHLGFFQKEYTPTYRGFETFYGFWNGKEDYWDHSSQEDIWGIDLRNNMKPVRNESDHYGTELFTEVAERIIDTHDKSQPLYLYLAQQAVHSANEHEPLQAPKRLQDKFPHFSSDERQTYAAMVASLDESVGNITKALKRNGLYDNSVIVFTTDNGGAPRGFNWNQGCNYPFKGGKDTFWEGGVRGVGFVHSKLIKKKGRVSYDLIDVTDWLPTFYHLAGGDVTKLQNEIDGMNVWDTISRGVKSPRTEVLHNIDPFRKFAAIRVKQYKLIINQDEVFRTTWLPRYALKGELENLTEPDTLRGAVIDCGKWDKDRNADCNTDKFPCLFNIEKDPCEYRNLASTHLHKVRDLLIRLIHYQANARPVWFPPRDPSASPAKHDGFWGPWMHSSKADKRLVRKAKKGVRHVTKSRDNVHVNGSGLRLGKKLSTQGQKDEEVYEMLHDILRVANEGKKGGILDNQNSLSKGSLARLYSKMKQKTDVDDLIHKVQIVKKAKDEKTNAGQADRKMEGSQAHDDDRKSMDSVESKNVQKEKQKRTEVGTILLKGAMQQTETGGLTDQHGIHSASTSKEADKQNIEVEITTVDPSKQIDNGNSEPSQRSADVGSEISGEESGSHNVDDDASDDASDDFDDVGDDTFNDEDENEYEV